MTNPRHFPLYTDSAHSAQIGLGIVHQKLGDEFGWVVRTVPQEHDFGIDAYVEVVTDAGEVTGRFLAIQVKCGRSFMASRNVDGFVYRGASKHLNYYMNHPMPVVLIVCDPEERTCWWEAFDGAKTSDAGDGWRITIPYDQRLDRSARQQLQGLAGPVADYSDDLAWKWAIDRMVSDENGSLLWTVDRSDIERLDSHSLLDCFARLEVTKELARKSQGKIHLVTSGYDDDPRELWEIPEVRAWMRAVDAHEPPWFWYLTAHPVSTSLLVVMFCLLPSRKVSNRTLEMDLDERKRFIEINFVRLNAMANWLGISEEEIIRISEEIGVYFQTQFAKT